MADQYDELYSEIQEVKEEIQNISAKVDQVIQMLSDFTIMLMEDPEEETEEYGYEDSWMPKEDDFWENEE
jgi:uncharacterized coiled-coil DUF342 family protein